MKLLIIPSWYPSASEKISGSFFQEQARILSDEYDIKVLIFRFSDRPSIRAFANRPLESTFAWMRFIFKRRSRANLPLDEVFSNPPLIEYGMSVIALTQQQRYEKRIDAYLKALDELISEGWKPDLIHAHSVALGGLVAQRIKALYKIPYVITEHMPFSISNYPTYMRDDIRGAFQNANIVLSLGYDMVRQLGVGNIYVDANLVYNLVDDYKFEKLCTDYKPGMPLKLVSIGAASHYKDHLTLLKALLLLRERGIPFKLSLIGLKISGSLYNETLNFISEHDLNSCVTVVDRVERCEVSGLLAKHNVYVMTSIFETFCVSIIEALASGLPVITTAHGGGSIDLINKSTGAVVNVRDFQAVAKKLEDIYNGRLRFNPHSIRNHVVEVCGTEAFKRRLSGYYEQAMREAA